VGGGGGYCVCELPLLRNAQNRNTKTEQKKRGGAAAYFFVFLKSPFVKGGGGGGMGNAIKNKGKMMKMVDISPGEKNSYLLFVALYSFIEFLGLYQQKEAKTRTNSQKKTIRTHQATMYVSRTKR
jgi:hypothetical protein